MTLREDNGNTFCMLKECITRTFYKLSLFCHSRLFSCGHFSNLLAITTTLRLFRTGEYSAKDMLIIFTNKRSGTLTLGGGGTAASSALIHGRQEGQELPFILNSFDLSYLLIGHCPLLWTSGDFKNFNKGGSRHNHAHSLGVVKLQPRPHYQRWEHHNLV